MIDRIQNITLLEIFNWGYYFYKSNFTRIFFLTLIFYIPIYFLGGLLQIYFPFSEKEFSEILNSKNPITIITEFLPMIIFADIKYVIEALYISSLTFFVSNLLLGIEVTVKDCIRALLKRVWFILIVGILTILLIQIGMGILIIPGLVFMVIYSIIIPISMVENVKLSQAYNRSYELVKPLWINVVILLLLIFLMNQAVTFISSQLASFNNDTKVILTNIGIEFILEILIAPYLTIPQIMLYFFLRSRKEDMTEDLLKADLEKYRLKHIE